MRRKYPYESKSSLTAALNFSKTAKNLACQLPALADFLLPSFRFCKLHIYVFRSHNASMLRIQYNELKLFFVQNKKNVLIIKFNDGKTTLRLTRVSFTYILCMFATGLRIITVLCRVIKKATAL